MARDYGSIKRIAEEIITNYLLQQPLNKLSGDKNVDTAIKELDEIYNLESLTDLDEETFKNRLTVILDYYMRAEPYEIMFARHADEFATLSNQQLWYLGVRIEIFAKEREDKGETA